MQLRQSTLVFAVIGALLGASVVATPAAAYSPNGFDSKVRCYARTLSTAPWEIELRRLVVMPPTIGAAANQKVGWRFIVQLRVNTVWTRTHTSPVQRAMGDGAFTPMGVKVVVPPWPGPEMVRSHSYRVVVKVFWYRADGSIQSTAKSPVYEYRVWIDGAFVRRETESCFGRERSLPGPTLLDTQAPSVPGLSGSTGSTGEASLSWSASTDDRAGQLEYEVMRNGMVIARVNTLQHRDFRGGVLAASYQYTVRAIDGAGNTSAASAGVEVAVDPSLFPFAGAVSRYGDRTKPEVALTFDDCVRITNIAEIVRILRANNAAGAFFCRGDQIGKAPAFYADLAREFALLNHGWSHVNFDTLTPSQVVDEAARTTEAIEAATGRPMPPLMRPPYGRANLTTQSALTEVGLRIVKWDIDTRDWEAGVTWETVRDSALAARNGSIVLMHDHTTTVNALPSIIAGLRSRGFELVSVAHLLGTAWQPATR